MLKTAYPTLYNKNRYFSVLHQKIAQIQTNNIFLSFHIKNSEYVIACIKPTAQADDELEIKLSITNDEKQTAKFWFVRYETFFNGNFPIPDQSGKKLLENIKDNVIITYNHLSLVQKRYTNSFILVPQNLVASISTKDRQLIGIFPVPETYFSVAFFTSLPGDEYIVDGTACVRMVIDRLQSTSHY